MFGATTPLGVVQYLVGVSGLVLLIAAIPCGNGGVAEASAAAARQLKNENQRLAAENTALKLQLGEANAALAACLAARLAKYEPGTAAPSPQED